MQETRQRILELIKMRGEATVGELTRELGLTAVTIRHHLDVLQRQGLIGPPQIRRRPGPGRPQHIYRLAGEAESLFPKRYDRLMEAILKELETMLPPEAMDKFIDGVVERMAQHVRAAESPSLSARLGVALEFLNGMGYLASIDEEENGFRLTVANCPYEQVAKISTLPCKVDVRLLHRLTGIEPERIQQIAAGDNRCVFWFPKA